MKYIKYILLMLVVIPTIVFAESKYSLGVIKDAATPKYLDDDHGYLTKKIISSNSEENTVTIEVKLKNVRQDPDKEVKTEIILLIDNSPSMGYVSVDGPTRRQLLMEASKELVNQLYDKYDNLKVGVIKFSSEYGGSSYTGEGLTIMTLPVADKNEVITQLNNIENNNYQESGTNIQKALIAAEESFTDETENKILVLLTDGLPSCDATHASLTNGQMVLTNETYLDILENTKTELIKVKNSGIKLISLLTGVNSGDLYNGQPVLHSDDDLIAIDMLFGTEDNPTAGIFYNIKTTDISEVIEDNISQDIDNLVNRPMTSITLIDFFPDYIIDNFYILDENGNPLTNFNSSDNSITIDVSVIKNEDEIVLIYTLKLKENFDKSILGKNLNTNNLVSLAYTDEQNDENSVLMNTSPIIKINGSAEEPVADNTPEPVVEEPQEVTPVNNPVEDTPKVEDEVENPETFDNMISSLIILGFSSLGLVYGINNSKKKYISVK